MSLEEAQARHKTAGRNDPCPCGSGKKYKKCHAAEDEAILHEQARLEAATTAVDEGEDDEKGSAKNVGAAKKTHGTQPNSNQIGSKARAQAGRAANLPRRGAI